MSSTNPISLENLFKIRPVEKDPFREWQLSSDHIQLLRGTKPLPYRV